MIPLLLLLLAEWRGQYLRGEFKARPQTSAELQGVLLLVPRFLLPFVVVSAVVSVWLTGVLVVVMLAATAYCVCRMATVSNRPADRIVPAATTAQHPDEGAGLDELRARF